MNKKVVWTIAVIVVLLAIILIATSGNKSDNTQNNQGQGANLPDTNQVQYNALATSADDFSALDEAVNTLG